MEPPKTDAPDLRAVAQGNHRVGYRGVVIRGWDTADERIVLRCVHRHPTTSAARQCVGGWIYGHWADGWEVVGDA